MCQRRAWRIRRPLSSDWIADGRGLFVSCGVPWRIRISVSDLRSRRPWPLDEGGVHILTHPSRRLGGVPLNAHERTSAYAGCAAKVQQLASIDNFDGAFVSQHHWADCSLKRLIWLTTIECNDS